MSAIQESKSYEEILIISSQVTSKVLEKLKEKDLTNADGSFKANNESKTLIIFFGSPHNCKYAAADPQIKAFIDSLKEIDAVYNVPTFGRGILNMGQLRFMRHSFGGWIIDADQFRVEKVSKLFGKAERDAERPIGTNLVGDANAVDPKLIADWKAAAADDHERDLIEEFRLFVMSIHFHIVSMSQRSFYTVEEHTAYMNALCGDDWYERTGECDSAKIINLMRNYFAARSYIDSMGTGLVSSNSGRIMPNDFAILSQSYANFIQNEENKSKMRWFANMCSLFKPVPRHFKKQGGAVSDILCVMAFMCGMEVSQRRDAAQVVDEMIQFEANPARYMPAFASIKNILVYMDGEPDDWTMIGLLLEYFGDRLNKVICFTRITDQDVLAVIMQYFGKLFGLRRGDCCEIITDRDQENIDKVVAIFKSEGLAVLI